MSNEAIKTFEEDFLNNLVMYFKNAQRGDRPEMITYMLLRDFERLLDIYSPESELLAQALDNLKPQIFEYLFSSDIFTKRLAPEISGMAKGHLVEALIYFGMPRKPAIEAIAKWLDAGESTIRTHNEQYRLKTKGVINDNNFEELFLKNPAVRNIILEAEESRCFPCDHPKAKRAYGDIKKLLFPVNER